jgi:hypothetical protein
MALQVIATVTRQFGSEGTPGLFVAYKRDEPNGAERRVGFFNTPSQAQRAVDGTMGGLMVRWKRDDMEGGIEQYVGYIDVPVIPA